MIDYDLLNYIPPDCEYDEWRSVGMALKHEGADLSVWQDWSARGSKYKKGECEKKWNSFRGRGITGGTLFYIACKYGYEPNKDNTEYDIHNLVLDEAIIDPSFVSPEAIPPVPDKYDPRKEMLEYFTELFEPDDFVGYCTDFWLDEKKNWKPGTTQYRRTAGDIIEKLRAGTIEQAIGTVNKASGAYVRFNPLDGKGETNANVTRLNYCLIESDRDDIEKQYSLLKKMNLPVKFLVYSGGKSLHAITHVDAETPQQYQQRVKELYKFCKDNGMELDEGNRNESRFSRLPGVMRSGKWQYIIDRDIGAPSYKEWTKWVADQADTLPPDTSLATVWDNMPELKPELIPGILRVGHKLLLAGPSKAGKSFLLINLAISIAEGIDWLGMECRQGRVCYVNLELDPASCFRRFKEIYDRRELDPVHIKDIDVWNLRGHSVPMDKLSPIMINRFKEKNYCAVIIDPIYKVITGDENNATEMSRFCSYFDKIAADMSVSVIYCHHHSKGATGKYANAADRSSGSGVFARDPDAILDMRELKTDKLVDKYRLLHPDANEVLTAWEISGTLREFPPAKPMRVWFDYPCHVPDDENYLAVAKYSDTAASGKGTGKEQNEKTDWFEAVEEILGLDLMNNAVSLEQLGISEANAKKQYSKETDYEVATIPKIGKVVHRRSEDVIRFAGLEYERTKWGNGSKWNPSSK